MWRRAFGPLAGWGIWFVLVAAAIAALAWITSLVVRRRSTEGVPPLVVFEPDGSVAAPRRRQDEPAACGVTNFKPCRDAYSDHCLRASAL